MHHALKVQEILFNIFGYCAPPVWSVNYEKATASPSLAALARTCHAFKEPALNVLWRVLDDLSPLARCLPKTRLTRGNMYSFTRPLTKIEWDILQSYARRVRSILDVHSGLNQKSLATLSNHCSATGPLFPSLRTLHGFYSSKSVLFLHLPLPSLVSLDVQFESLSSFQEFFESFPIHSSNIRRLNVRADQTTPLCIESNHFCRWRNLCSLICPQLALDRDALVHLSQMRTLARLEFASRATLTASDVPIFFCNLNYLTLHSKSLQPTSLLLSQIQLPAITDFTAFIEDYPSRQELSSFIAGIQTSSAGNTIKRLSLAQTLSSEMYYARSQHLLLGLEDLKPCMEFSNLRHLLFNFAWSVGLTDSDVLTLATAWPQLEHLLINQDWGWNSRGGITPGGLVHLLQTCRPLSRLALALDTRGYTDPPSSEVLASLRSTLSPEFFINVLDSPIEAESVPAVATFFTGFAGCSKFTFYAWFCERMALPLDAEEYRRRWKDIRRVKGGCSRVV